MYLFGIHSKAIQIAVSHFLYQELMLTHIRLHMSLLRSITNFILNSSKALVAQMRISSARIDYMHLIEHTACMHTV